MIETPSFSATSEPVAVLFHPSVVPVIDVFRSLNTLEDQYDLSLLDAPERSLSVYTQSETAKGIVSDALLLGFAMTRQRGRPLSYRPIGSRHGSMDEYCLLALIRCSNDPASEVAQEAAALLEIASLDFVATLAGELVRQMDMGALVFERPSPSDFRALMGYGRSEEVVVESVLSRAEFQFR